MESRRIAAAARLISRDSSAPAALERAQAKAAKLIEKAAIAAAAKAQHRQQSEGGAAVGGGVGGNHSLTQASGRDCSGVHP